jgi:hypothetical protein
MTAVQLAPTHRPRPAARSYAAHDGLRPGMWCMRFLIPM